MNSDHERNFWNDEMDDCLEADVRIGSVIGKWDDLVTSMADSTLAGKRTMRSGSVGTVRKGRSEVEGAAFEDRWL